VPSNAGAIRLDNMAKDVSALLTIVYSFEKNRNCGVFMAYKNVNFVVYLSGQNGKLA